MKTFKFWNTLVGWLVFAIAAATYLLTIEPTASFWDCGEFISSAYKLDVGHPPGAPFFMLMGHFFSLFASDPSHVAMCCNAMSALASAFTILFLFWTITALGRKLLVNGKGESLAADEQMSLWQVIALLGAGSVGALAYTFSDTFWFSAVEGEVYASSSFFTAVVFWLILKWDEKADEEGSDKWLILIAYLMGLSIGVHLLNLLTIPAIVLVYYFRKYDFSWKGVLLALLASVGILAVVLYGMIPGFPTVAGWFELLFVNVLGCPFNTGLAIYLVLTIGALAWAVFETYRNKSYLLNNISFALAVTLVGIPFIGESVIIGVIFIAALLAILFWKRDFVPARWLNTTTLMIAVIMIGYSSYAAIVIRSAADTPMDQNSPDNVFSLKYYLNREQYGDRPLLYGQTYSAPVDLRIEGNMCVPIDKQGRPQYAPAPKTDTDTKDHYIITGYKSSYQYMKEFCMLFPRMYSPDQRHVQAYKDWGDVKGKKISYDYCGQKKTDVCPTFGENLTFFFRYQLHFMYWRYFMWNFAGRQNDLQGYGEISKGNWLSGISFIDNARLGDQDALPSELKNNKGHNVYYMLPLLLGLLGMVIQLARRRQGIENFTLTMMLFIMTGIAIVVYLNQTPYQPRERDYAYAASFYAFSIWIGLGVLAITEFVNRLLKSDNKVLRSVVAAIVTIVCLGVPALMAQQNWDDHDRSDRYSCRDFGANYLKSCESNGIIFSNGDNDTFPLWYNQEVEGVGNDLRVCNLSYVQTDWYISQMKRPYYESEALPITWEPKDYISGTNEVVWVDNRLSEPMTVKQAFDFVRSDKSYTKRDGENYLPTSKLYIPIDKQEVIASGLFDKDIDNLAQQIDINVRRRLTKSEMMVLEMVSSNHWRRPMYFAVTVGNDYYQGMERYFELTGLAYQITPVASRDGQPRVNTEKMYDNMMHNFKYGNMNKPGIYIDENLMRMCRTHRMMFGQLADALLAEGQTEKALEVLDRAMEELPLSNVNCDYTAATMAVDYYQLGETQKANEIMQAVADNAVEYLQWGATLNRDYRKAMQQTLGQQLALLSYTLQYFDRYKQDELFEKYYAEYLVYAKN
ncbi:MAG: DUF2723 domain-containing protein [Paludibacteraceae bacterium]|nr:DUF2723 domain-containing protein [Paludibacteraceae bacterium]